MKEIYQTTDGKEFEDRHEAHTHENALFEAWVEEHYAEELAALDGMEEDEIYATPQDILKWALRKYYNTK